MSGDFVISDHSFKQDELILVAFANIFDQSKRINDNGNYKAECYCEYTNQNSNKESDYPKNELNGKEPDNAVKIKCEDQPGESYKTPAEDSCDHITDKVVAEYEAGYKCKSGYYNGEKCEDLCACDSDCKCNCRRNTTPNK